MFFSELPKSELNDKTVVAADFDYPKLAFSTDKFCESVIGDQFWSLLRPCLTSVVRV